MLTGAGRLPYTGIIHVAAITLWGASTPALISASVRSALALAQHHEFDSIAFPVLGSGSGGVPEPAALAVMTSTLQEVTYPGRVRIVRYRSAGA